MRQKMASEHGVVAPLVAVVLLGLLGITALVIDGGVMFSARRDLQGLADSAARAGAMAIDVSTLRSNDQVILDPAVAEREARDYLRTAGFTGQVSITLDTLSVTVDLTEDHPTVMMGLLGIRTMRTEAHAVARPRAGIERPEG